MDWDTYCEESFEHLLASSQAIYDEALTIGRRLPRRPDDTDRMCECLTNARDTQATLYDIWPTLQ